MPFKLDVNEFIEFINKTNFRSSFWGQQVARYIESARAISTINFDNQIGGRCLEVGASWLFADWFRLQMQFAVVDGTAFEPSLNDKIIDVVSPFINDNVYRAFNIDLESEVIPVDDNTYDFVTSFEVIEHMDVDPMFFMAEINRCIKIGGYLVLSTPNVTSLANVEKILKGYAPHFYMVYQRDRNPFRHNFEYDPHQIKRLVESAGFEIKNFYTADTFGTKPALSITDLEFQGFETRYRGDNMFIVAQKVSKVKDRYPVGIYDERF